MVDGLVSVDELQEILDKLWVEIVSFKFELKNYWDNQG